MAYLIDKNGNKESINYYELGSKLESIIKGLTGEQLEDYKKFSLSYNKFYPYFDYAILKLGYVIEEPFGPDTLIREVDGKIRYYHPDPRTGKPYSERIYQLDRVNVEPIKHDAPNLDSGILDRLGNYFTIPKITSVHTTLPIMLVNYMVMNNKELYDKYINYDIDFSKDMCFLEDMLGYIRVSFSHNDSNCTLMYSGSMISDREKSFINYLKSIGYAKEGFVIDTDKKPEYQKRVHRDKS